MRSTSVCALAVSLIFLMSATSFAGDRRVVSITVTPFYEPCPPPPPPSVFLVPPPPVVAQLQCETRCCTCEAIYMVKRCTKCAKRVVVGTGRFVVGTALDAGATIIDIAVDAGGQACRLLRRSARQANQVFYCE